MRDVSRVSQKCGGLGLAARQVRTRPRAPQCMHRAVDFGVGAALGGSVPTQNVTVEVLFDFRPRFRAIGTDDPMVRRHSNAGLRVVGVRLKTAYQSEQPVKSSMFRKSGWLLKKKAFPAGKSTRGVGRGQSRVFLN